MPHATCRCTPHAATRHMPYVPHAMPHAAPYCRHAATPLHATCHADRHMPHAPYMPHHWLHATPPYRHYCHYVGYVTCHMPHLCHTPHCHAITAIIADTSLDMPHCHRHIATLPHADISDAGMSLLPHADVTPLMLHCQMRTRHMLPHATSPPHATCHMLTLPACYMPHAG
jgi:hypothetical protein